MTKVPKIRFAVKVRLSPNSEFVLLHDAYHSNFASAKERMEGWLKGNSQLAKAKPEAEIETQELKHMADCKKCGTALFQQEVVQYTHDGIFCYDCAETRKDGYFDLLDSENFSLDNPGGV